MPIELDANNAAYAADDSLVIVRQSSTQAHDDLYAMLERTLNLYPFLSGWDEIYGRGIDPLLGPGPGDMTEDLPSSGRASLYKAGSTWVLLILGSAAAPNDGGADHAGHENAVVTVVNKVIKHLRPRNVYIGPFDRVVRSLHFAQKSYAAFKDAEVEWLWYESMEGPESIRFGAQGSDDTFYDLAKSAHSHLKVVVTRTTRGKASLARRNKWFLGAPSTPFGLTMDASRRLVLALEDRDSLRIIVRGFAEGDTDADIARRLMSEAPVRRRRGEEGLRLRDGEIEATSPHSSFHRHCKTIRVFRGLMLDLAMGKLVLPQLEPPSTQMSHVGVRREAQGHNSFAFYFVWDVPDLFEGIDNDVLDAAMCHAARRLHRGGQRPSTWLYECDQRQQQIQLVRDEPESSAGLDARQWLNGDLELKRAVGSGPELARAWRVREIVASVAGEPTTGQPNTSMSPRPVLFSGYPTWRVEDQEWRIKSTPTTYTFLKRPADTTKSRAQSMARKWDLSGGFVPRDLITAQFPQEVFTRSLVDAAVAAVETGIPVLRGQRAAASGIAGALERRETVSDGRLDQLKARISRAAEERDAAVDRQESLSRRKQRGGTADAGYIDRQIDEAVDKELDAAERIDKLRKELNEEAKLRRSGAAENRKALPELDDLDLVLDTLAAMRTRRRGDRQINRDVQNLFQNIRLVSQDLFHAAIEFQLILPTPDSSHLGTIPIRASVPLGGKPDRWTSWGHTYAHALCTQQLALDHCRTTVTGGTLRSSGAEAGQRAYESALKYLKREAGLRHNSAKHLLSTVNLLPRTVAYCLITDTPIDSVELGVTQAYVDVIRQTFLSAHSDLPVKRPDQAMRRHYQKLLNAMLGSNKPYWRSEDIAEFRGYNDADEKYRAAKALKWVKIPRENIDGLLRVTTAWGMSRDGKNRNLPAFTPRPCPHCDRTGEPHPLDIVVWNPEVPGGLLCSRCLRSGRDDSIVYPPSYRALLECGDDSAMEASLDASPPAA